ncbi:hypothetical protein [Marinomonas transparens]|uniref:DUF1737 domain-containing protein n=1 Tax=Marinomonas transparens TaxID=2795388 RepID=A0A934JZR6_9GAMM|nr:hypothetical protein [Marinomonas transparens]MBJ7539877.1 hypothetical protein [Marinomonas transparens]
MEYRLVEVGSRDHRRAVLAIEESVNELAQKGWRPQGGVSHYEKDEMIYYLQAMILE